MLKIKMIQIIFFLSVAILIIYGSHFYLHATITRFLALSQSQSRMLGLVLYGLATSFIVTILLNRLIENQATEWLYIASSVWYGLFANLLLAATAGWVIYGLSSLSRFTIDPRRLTAVLCLLAIIVSGYGIYNARYPLIKNINVKIKNLPPDWSGKTAVQITDLHLGAIYGIRWFTALTKNINSLNPDIVFITGDLFDGTGPDLTGLAAPLKDITASYGVYFVNGNHETYIGRDKVAAALAGTGVRYLRSETAMADGLTIAGLDYADRGEKEDPAGLLKGLDPDQPTILLKHAPNDIGDISAAKVDLVLSGHTHRGQLFPFGLITRLIFGKYHTGLNPNGDLTAYSSPGTGTWGPPMRTSGRSEITVIKFE